MNSFVQSQGKGPAFTQEEIEILLKALGGNLHQNGVSSCFDIDGTGTFLLLCLNCCSTFASLRGSAVQSIPTEIIPDKGKI